MSEENLAAAIERSVEKRFRDNEPDAGTVAAYVDSLHAAELALAVGCAAGHDRPWEHFMTTYRPILYRAARALAGDEATARELADTLWSELYGVGGTRVSLDPGSERRSLLTYFHGRSQLATWLRSVLAQRHVDLVRGHRREEALDADDREETGNRISHLPAIEPEVGGTDRARYVAAFQSTLSGALATLDPRDRLRLSCYYVQGLTLAETGRVLGEHEATVSRRLTRVRTRIRAAVERALTREHGLTSGELDLCYRYATEESAIDVKAMLGEADRTPATVSQGSDTDPF